MNENLKKIRLITEKFDPIKKTEKEILGLHEAASKLWAKSVHTKNKEELGKKLINCLIGVSRIAASLKINDIEYHLQKRLIELEKELKN